MNREDALRQLRQADPAPPDAVRGAARGPVARDALERILEAPREEHAPRAPRRASLGIAASVVTVLIVISVAIMQGPAEVELPSVRAVLSQAAETARRAGSAEVGPGRFLYTRTEMTETSTFTNPEGSWSVLIPVVREFWIAADGSGRVREVPGRPTFPGPRDRERWRTFGRPRIEQPVSDRIVGPGTFASNIGSEESTDARLLTSALLASDVASDLPQNQRLFAASSDLLSRPLAGPVLRSALFRFLAGLDRVELLGEVQDPMGRSGIGVAIPSRSNGALARRVLIFDEETSAVLAEEVVLLERVGWMDASPPIIIESRIFGQTANVASDHARPRT